MADGDRLCCCCCRRPQATLLARLVQNVVMGLIFGFIFFRIGADQAHDLHTRLGSIFMASGGGRRPPNGMAYSLDEESRRSLHLCRS